MVAAGIFMGSIMIENPVHGLSVLMPNAISLVMMFIGIGNHIKEPKRVTKKTLANSVFLQSVLGHWNGLHIVYITNMG